MTIQEMANALGLSRNTVSLALKDNEIVSESTRRRVQEYALKAGYYKAMPAVSDIKHQYRVLVLRRPNEAVFWDRIMSGIMQEARKENCLIQAAVVLEEDVESMTLPAGCNDGIDAFLFLNLFPQEYVQMILRYGHIGIFLDGDVQVSQSTMLGDMVKVEGTRCVYCMTKQLISQGLRRIAFLSSTDVSYCQTIWDRLIGYQHAMEEANLPMTTMKDLLKINKNNVYNLEELTSFVDSIRKMPEAFVCSNDVIAERLIRILEKRNIRVPEDVAVTGFDNIEALNVRKFITTADFQGEWLGRRLVQQILWRFRHPEAPYEVVTLDSRIIYRRSSEKTLK